MKLELLTNATVVDDAIRFVSSNTDNIRSTKQHRGEGDNPKVNVDAYVVENNDNNFDLQRPGEESKYRSEGTTSNAVF